MNRFSEVDECQLQHRYDLIRRVVQFVHLPLPYTGSSTSHYKGSVRHSAANGSYASFTFTGGKGVAWVAPKGDNRGYAHIYLDRVKVAAVVLYSASALYRRMVYAKTGLNPDVTHTLKVYVPGTKRSASTGTRVDVDGFVVLR